MGNDLEPETAEGVGEETRQWLREEIVDDRQRLGSGQLELLARRL